MTGGLRHPGVFGRVGVAMGGWSAERDISLRSGGAILNALRAGGVDAHGVDVVRGGIRGLAGFDRIFIALHGRGGEDGVIQGWLAAEGIPHTGSGVLGSALAMDKLRAKRQWRAAGLATPEFAVLRGLEDIAQVTEALGLPLIVKPVAEGSSLGMSRVERAADLPAAWEAARPFGEVFAERWVGGAEYTAAILGGEVLPLIRLETPRAFYDYEAKYQAGDTRFYCPSGLPREREEAFGALAAQAFEVLGCTGWGRVDLRCDEAGEPWLIEANTVPGMTDHSLVPMAARAAGIDFPTLVLRILEQTLTPGGDDGAA